MDDTLSWYRIEEMTWLATTFVLVADTIFTLQSGRHAYK